MRQRQHSAFMLAAACISSALLMVGIAAHPAAARDKSVSQPLPAQTLDQIKGVGQALLQAKRAYQSPDEVNALRQDMDQLHGLLEKLTQPKRGDTLRLETANGRAEDGASRDPWRGATSQGWVQSGWPATAISSEYWPGAKNAPVI